MSGRLAKARTLILGGIAAIGMTLLVVNVAAPSASAATALRVGVGATPALQVGQQPRTSTPVAAATATNTSRAAATPKAGEKEASLSKVLGGLRTDGARMSVAVLDTATGAGGFYGSGSYDTASIVKVDILSTLLLQAQDARRALTDQEQDYATAMIEHSDNNAATALWDEIGAAPGLDAANKRLGLTNTQAGQNGYWGLTQSRRSSPSSSTGTPTGRVRTGSACPTAARGRSQAPAPETPRIPYTRSHRADEVFGKRGVGSAFKEGRVRRFARSR
ncbi:class A beta-lactamase-related serine hydrolase [Streptomyces sp. RB6PN25]|uniref:Class A beta-lactamase-related serine hydrolase n=1 Tax=Streptomyces humicola TaxID=2953240 RepID=A0ABT1PMZ7_9ACTN|nr:class A beta-lactamase-related serine hydrolase [Streptomyces humicola]MCQ4079053.1 class A beta-lactamase-related serine hydrolase [Streptomyces humicola]